MHKLRDSDRSFQSASSPLTHPPKADVGLPDTWLQILEEADLGPVTTPDLWLPRAPLSSALPACSSEKWEQAVLGESPLGAGRGSSAGAGRERPELGLPSGHRCTLTPAPGPTESEHSDPWGF